MKNILFSHSYFLRFDPKQWNNGQPYAPLGTLYAAALLRGKGYDVAVFDTMFCESAEEILGAFEKNPPDIFVLYDDGFNYLTKMCLSNMREAAFRMIGLSKKRGCITIVSSSDSSDHFEKYLQQGADFVLIGEAEQTLLELVNAIEKGEEISHIPGIAYLQEGHAIKSGRRAVMDNLDDLPLPAWDLVDMKPYRDMWMAHSGFFSMNMATTRGCPFKCNWCAKPIYGNRYHSRSPEHVVKELAFLKKEYGFDHIWFCDDIFGLKPGWVNEFAALLERENLRFRFKIQSRADLLTRPDEVIALARAGCEDVWMGAESGSQKILDAMDKGTTIAQIAESTRLLKEKNIRPSFFIQFGYPGETRHDIEATIRLINTLRPYEIGISVSYPLPGTVFFERVKTELQVKTNWTDSDELALLFHNTYAPAFYKRLHRYVHKNYRQRLAFDQVLRLFRHPLQVNITALRKAASLLYYIPAVLIEKFRLWQAEKLPA